VTDDYNPAVMPPWLGGRACDEGLGDELCCCHGEEGVWTRVARQLNNCLLSSVAERAMSRQAKSRVAVMVRRGSGPVWRDN